MKFPIGRAVGWPGGISPPGPPREQPAAGLTVDPGCREDSSKPHAVLGQFAVVEEGPLGRALGSIHSEALRRVGWLSGAKG
jgi:hypothetical protein